ncbi:SPRY-domain-containing protein [Russula earlei]|uniref:SPRY-domain-containing protein n=1 Tax=Russula earlei TaxID=71964 RepID=A0ACC0UKW4_9AGAM|nr:SPRY-domain-containing protein [Russula earlei]
MMAARPTNRSSSMSIPRPPLPSLEDIMSSVSPANPRTISPTISAHRQQSVSSLSGATSSRSITFPRIIRANNTSGSPPAQLSNPSRTDVACTPPLSNSPTRTRRPSAGPLGLRSTTLHRPGSHTHTTLTSPHLAFHQSPPPFPRPAYLEHSSLRHLLQTELPPNLPPSRYTQSTIYPFAPRHLHTSVTPALMDDSDVESTTASPPPPGLPPSPPASATARAPSENVTLVSSSPVFRLPTRWSEQDRHTYLSVSADGRELTYHGGSFQNGGSTDNAAMARTNHPIPPACGIYYYEIEILSKTPKAHISIGFAAGDTRLNKLPGWEKNSWGYHGDDGYSFSAEKAGNTYGPTFGGGDTVGAGIDFSQNRAFFTKNGALIGMVFEHVACDVQVFPSVGLRHSNEHVRVNFGHTTFKYDIDDHAQQRRDTVWATIQNRTLDWRILDPGRDGTSVHTSRADADGTSRTTMEDEGRDEAARLVLNYLIHHGYAKTAEALQIQLDRVASPALPVPPPASALAPASDVDSPMLSAERVNESGEPNMLEQRLAIVRAVRRGNIDGALDDLKQRFPNVLDRDGGMMRLKLRCRQFVELVNAAAEAKRALSTAASSSHNGAEDVDAMDVDDDSPAQAALKAALEYGRALRAEYKKEEAERSDVHALLERTWSVIAYHFPVEVGGEVGRWAGQDARDILAGEVNQVILESQGFPRRPALERIYRQTGACLVQLGFLGVGAAVFADLQRELLD